MFGNMNQSANNEPLYDCLVKTSGAVNLFLASSELQYSHFIEVDFTVDLYLFYITKP